MAPVGDEHDPRERSAAGHARRRGWGPRVTKVLVLALGLYVVAVAALAILGARSALAGARQVRDLEATADVDALVDGSATEDLGRAHRHFARADRLLGNALLGPARLLPVAGRNLRAATALAATAADVTGATVDAARAVTDGPEGARSGGGVLVAEITRVRGKLDAVQDALDRADLGPERALAEPLRQARTEVAEALARAEDVAGDAAVVLEGLERFLSGPSRALVIAANNAEMRVGSGMFLSIGAIEVVDGAVRVTHEMQPAADLVLPERVPLPPELASLWGWSGLGTDWRSLALSARFPAQAALGQEMWARVSPDAVEGVLALDVAALRALLEITGPVEVGGVPIGSGDVVDHLLHEQYEDADDRTANDARRDRLAELAEATLERLDDVDLDVGALLRALRPARDGRHLLAWSADPHVQRAWEVLGVAGELDHRSLLVGVANVDGGKLDPYVAVDITARTGATEGDVHIELQVDLTNAAPDGLPAYVQGTDGSPDHRALLVVHLPAAAQAPEVEGFDGVAALGPDGPTTVLAAPVRVAQGQTRTGHVRFTLPRGEHVVVEPSAHLPPARWTADGRTRTDEVRWSLPLPEG